MIWITLFYIMIIWSLFDGFVGLVIPSTFIALSRDIMLTGIYFLFFTSEQFFQVIAGLRKSLGESTFFLMAGFFVVGFLQIFNPITPGLTLGLLGFKVVYFYWPLMILGYAYAADMSRVRKLLSVVAYCSIPINIFGIYQFYKGPNWLIGTFGPGMLRALGMYHGVDESRILFRALGTFASGGLYAVFLVTNTVLCLALIYSVKKRTELFIWIGVIVLNITAVLITGTRGALLTIGLYLFVYAIFSRKARATVIGALILGVAFYVGFSLLGEKTIKRFSTLTDIEMIKHRTVETTGNMFLLYVDRYPMGKGLGTASQATRYLGGLEGKFSILVENYASKLQVETGLPGVVLFYGFMISLFLRWFFRWKSVILPHDQAIIFPLSAYCISQLGFRGIFGSIETSPGSLFLWLFIGIVARRAAMGEENLSLHYQQQYPEYAR